MGITRQDAAFGIAVINRSSKLLAAAVKLGKDSLIRDAIDEEINYRMLAHSIMEYIKEDQDPVLFEELMHLADTKPIWEYLSRRRTGTLPAKVKDVAEVTDELIAYGNEAFHKGTDEFANLVPFFANPQAKELFDRAVNAGLLKKDYQPAPGVERYQLKVIAIAINAIMKFSFRDKWCHFVEQWGEEINRCMVPLTKGAAINQIVRLYKQPILQWPHCFLDVGMIS